MLDNGLILLYLCTLLNAYKLFINRFTAQNYIFLFKLPNIFTKKISFGVKFLINILQMNGKVLQERLQDLTTMSFTDIANRIGVSPQSMYQFFEAKDVRSGLIEKLCEVLDVDLYTLYGMERPSSIVNNGGDVVNGHNVSNNHSEMNQQVLDILERQLNVKDEQISGLINLLNK